MFWHGELKEYTICSLFWHGELKEYTICSLFWHGELKEYTICSLFWHGELKEYTICSLFWHGKDHLHFIQQDDVFSFRNASPSLCMGSRQPYKMENFLN